MAHSIIHISQPQPTDPLNPFGLVWKEAAKGVSAGTYVEQKPALLTSWRDVVNGAVASAKSAASSVASAGSNVTGYVVMLIVVAVLALFINLIRR